MRSRTEGIGCLSNLSEYKSESLTESARGSTRVLGKYRRKIEPLIATSLNNCTLMPLTGMRRTTRVFGVVKGVDGARVLRSGRLLCPEYSDGKIKVETRDRKHRFRPIENKSNGQGYVRTYDAKLDQDLNMVDRKSEVPSTMVIEAVTADNNIDRMCGLVYTRRKRKRSIAQSSEIFDSSENKRGAEDRRYGVCFMRRQRMKKSNSVVSRGDSHHEVLTIVLESVSSSRNGSFAGLLYSILRYMRKASMKLSQLSEFLWTEPIGSVYSSVGISFFLDPPTSVGSGTCRILGVNQCIPLFSVNFAALSQCFMYIHSSMLLRKCWPNALVYNWKAEHIMVDSKFQQMSNSSKITYSECKSTGIEVDNPVNKFGLHPSVRASKLAGRTAQYRNGLNYRSIRKRRSSIKTRRARDLSVICVYKLHGALVSDFACNRKNAISFPWGVTNKLRRSTWSSSSRIFKEVNSRPKQDIDSSCCTASILVIESDRCYRVDGSNVTLEFSAAREWLLVVKKDGLVRYSHKAQEVMRPCSCNRFTHAIIWTSDNDWKLEFPDRGDWLIFKDLYKECSDRNVLLASDVRIIPVPPVREVSGYEDSTSATFFRPNSYIKLNDDEVSRALAKKTANYEVDMEDEEWLKDFNIEYVANNENHECISADSFELMIDAFEKAFYFNPDDIRDEAAALSICLDLVRREVVEAVYSYWMNKRKQKRSSLLRIFQGHEPKKTSHVPKPALRKRRSMKRRHPSQSGRGTQPIVEQALVTEQDKVVAQAKAAASRAQESAILKRRRAQLRMENADLVAYKATVALRIAEAAEVTGQREGGAAHPLDWRCGANDANLICDLSITVRQSAS